MDGDLADRNLKTNIQLELPSQVAALLANLHTESQSCTFASSSQDRSQSYFKSTHEDLPSKFEAPSHQSYVTLPRRTRFGVTALKIKIASTNIEKGETILYVPNHQLLTLDMAMTSPIGSLMAARNFR